ncbi:MAG: ferrous iron transport protein A [Clostridiales bacterium]|jgi:Fe2+ transport system protein FeoA|nr:ferrous iron transport protein A [Clostridiales bacterium]HOB63708.1 ferrous iron transport protein A [Clostridia bacterium]HOK81850.1 ferrous iron transport protein A [Clostridia bacterium]HOL60917.1 ferrous iron transport protein A [Clostridia bacterium]HPO53577.1 ferrous iron transport protein A [Clostridia bacterium]
MTLDALQTGEKAKITKVEGEGSMRKRLLDMGLTPGTNITLFKKAPMGDPIEIVVRGYHLTLRISDARKIFVAKESAK